VWVNVIFLTDDRNQASCACISIDAGRIENNMYLK